MRYTAKKMFQDRCLISPLKRLLRWLRPHLITLSPAVLCLVYATALPAQERVRTAAAKLEIESFRRPETFFRLGPFEEELTGSTGFEFTDNSSLAQTGKLSRFSLLEGFDLLTRWRLSHINELEVKFGGRLREDFYGNGKNNVNFSIAPDSLVQFKFAVSDVQVRLYDHFSYTQEPTTNPTATNTAYLNSLTNTLGAEVREDFNLAIVSFSSDYTYNNQSGSNASGQSNPSTSGTRNTFRVGSSVAFRWTPTVLYGIETTLTRSTGSSGGSTTGASTTGASANINSLNIGPFVRGRLSRLTDFDLAAGAILVDTKPSFAPTYYLSAVVRHQFNPNLRLILSGSHDLVFSTGTDLVEESVFRAVTEFNLTRFITFTAAPSLLLGDARATPHRTNFQNVQGNFKDYVFEASVGWKPRRHLTTAITYDFRRRDATSAGGSYSQNTISFGINYVF
jgi:hypothetical protein